MTIILFGKHKGKEYSEIPNDYIAWLLAKDVIKGKAKETLIEFLLKEKPAELLQAWIEKNYKKKVWVPATGSYGYSSDEMDYEPGHWEEQSCPFSTGDRDFEGTGGSCDWMLDAYDFPEPF